MNLFLLLIVILKVAATFANNRFIGCYTENTDPPLDYITGYNTTECIRICEKRFYKYTIIQGERNCLCDNFLKSSVYSSKPCKEACENCSVKDSLGDVYVNELVVPGPPQDLQVHNVTDTTAFVSWKPPKSLVNIEYYEINTKVLHTFSSHNVMNSKYRYSNNTFDTELNFQPGTKYNVTLQAVSKFGESATSFAILETNIGLPDNVPSTPTILKRDGRVMIVQLNPVMNNNGPVSAYLLVVINEDVNPILQMENFKSYAEAMRDGLNYYVTAEIRPKDILNNFTVGDGKIYGSYYNAPLLPHANYKLLLGVVSTYNNVTKAAYSNITDSFNFVTISIMPAPESEEEVPAIIIGLSIAIGLLSFLLIVGIIGFFLLTRRISNRRRRLTDNQELTMQGPIIEVENTAYIPEDEVVPINHYNNLRQQLWSIPQTLIKFEPTNLLGAGKFGRVNSGTVRKDNVLIPVAIYTIPDRKLAPENKRAMLKDLDLLIRSKKDENLLNLIGTCETPDTLFVVLEYASTNLKDLLLGSREALPGRFSNMQESQAFDISIGIARGMRHLGSLKIVHKQLCARNILITDGLTPKVSGYGLAQYCNPNMLPDYTRWTAAEVFHSQQYVSKCDVWSFACLLWEICVLGGTPYGSVPNNEIPEKVMRGLRLVQMRYFSEDLYQTMLNCWQLDLDERPTFQNLIDTLTSIKEDALNSHLNFNLYPEFQYEQFYPSMEMVARTFH